MNHSAKLNTDCQVLSYIGIEFGLQLTNKFTFNLMGGSFATYNLNNLYSESIRAVLADGITETP
jgi:hypothetical protein